MSVSWGAVADVVWAGNSQSEFAASQNIALKPSWGLHMLGMGNLGNLANLLKGAQEMQRKMAQLQERLAQETVEGSAGGGMVRVTANGRGEVLGVEIEPSLVSSDDREMMQDLVVAATNQALGRAKERAQEEMARVLGPIGLPPEVFNLPGITGR